jgi:PAS domain S-box-containing protein
MKKNGLWIVTILVFAGVILGTLGTWSVPLGHGISAFWPAFVVQTAGGIWFGGWGVLAAVLFPVFTNSLANVGWSGIFGFIPANLAQGLIPAWAFRYFRADPAIRDRKGLIFYAIWGAIIPAAAGGLVGSIAVILFGDATWDDYFRLAVQWSLPNMAVSLLIGTPIVRVLTPLWRDLGVLVKGWWVFDETNNQVQFRNFQDMPIQLKLVLAMCGAGLGPLLVLSLLELAKNGGKSEPGSLTPLFLAISLMTLILAVGILSRETVRPLQKLKEQVESLMQYRNSVLEVERMDEIGQLGQAFAFLLDDWRRADALLLASEEKYRTLVENLTVGVFQSTLDGTFLHANSAVIRMAGYDNWDAFQQRTAASLYADPADRQQLIAELLTRGRVWNVEARSTKKDGTIYWIAISAVLIKDKDGNPASILGSVMDITERKQAGEILRHRLIELEAVNHISAALRVAQTPDEMLPLLLDETLAALESESGAVSLYRPEDESLHVFVARGWFKNLADIPIKSGEGITGTVFASGKLYISHEFAHDPLTNPVSVKYIPAGWGGVCVPIRDAAEVVGVMYISVSHPREITAEQTNLLTSVAEMAGTALHRLRLYGETRRQVEYLQALRMIDQAITTSLDKAVTVAVLLDQAKSKLHVDAVGVLLFNPDLSTLEHAAGVGFNGRIYERTRLRLGQGLAGRAAYERQLIKLLDVYAEPNFEIHSLFREEQFKAYLAMPLIAKGELKGVLEIFHRQPLKPDDEWSRFLESLVGQAAIAIDNFQLFEGLQRSNFELVHAYDATIEGWSRALDLRDKETEGHTLRVVERTLRLARVSGFSENEMVHIRRGALLHDIGKMGVPDSILLKPGMLTDEEMAFMKKHPVFAYEFLSPIRYLKSTSIDIPYCHHEKWDGTGYPRGLKGEEIPFIARLFAVIDVWDALTSDRPYRPAWSQEKTLAYIREQSGNHFDPKVVEKFLHMLEEDPELR